jgi:hypothetical protein
MYKYERMSRYILNEVERSHHLLFIRLYFILTILNTKTITTILFLIGLNVDKFFFCLFWRMVHKSYTLNLCLEEWFINLPIHTYQYKILLRLFHHFSFHSCCSYWILVYFRFVLHFSIFCCVSHFSIFPFVAFRFAF